MMKPRLGNVIEPVLKLVKKPSETAGLPPGTPVFVGEQKAREVKISVLDYDGRTIEYRKDIDVKECLPYREKPSVTWINVEGLHETALIDDLGSGFGLHPLTVEDILNTHQRSKVEVFDDYVFVAIKVSFLDEESGELEVEHAGIVLGEYFVLTFQEKRSDVFDPVRARINQRGRIIRQGADYLAYALIDTIVDNYFGILEVMGERIEDIEDELMADPGPGTLQDIHSLKKQLLELRKSAWPMREIINGFQRSESRLVKDSTRPYLRDLYDHAIQVIDTLETHREMIAGMLDIYLSGLSNRMNEVMKVLTIFASIFIPLTFIAGVYGMNFKYMPELEWPWGYFGVLGLMAVVGISLLIYFKRKRWF